MHVAPVQNHTAASAAAALMYGDGLPTQTERSASLKTPNDSAAIKKAASQFEAIILRQLLAPSIEPMMSGGMGGASSAGGGIYGYMLTDSLAGSLAQGGGLGLAKMLEKQFSPHAAQADIKSNAELKPLTH